MPARVFATESPERPPPQQRSVLWNAKTLEQVAELIDTDRQLLSVTFHPNRPLVATPGRDAEVHLFEVPGGALYKTLTAGEKRALFLEWNPDGTLLAVGYEDGTVRLWDFASASQIAELETGGTGYQLVSFRPDGRVLATAASRTVRLWSVKDGRRLEELSPRAAVVHRIAWSPDGTRLAAGLSNHTLEIWDASDGAVLLRRPFEHAVFFVRFERSGDGLYALPLDQTVRVLRAAR